MNVLLMTDIEGITGVDNEGIEAVSLPENEAHELIYKTAKESLKLVDKLNTTSY